MLSQDVRFRCVAIGVYLAFVIGASTLAYAGAAIVFGALTSTGLRLQQESIGSASRATKQDGAVTQRVTSGRVLLTQDDWVERLRTREYWEGRSSSGSGPTRPSGTRASAPARLGADRLTPIPFPPLEPRAPAPRSFDNDGNDGTYRTMCVRLCDGYYFPVSFATTEENFERDEARCKASCTSSARLFVYKNPGGEIEDMKDLNDQPYSKLKTAFLYRNEYSAQCKCKPDPWEAQAIERHRLYALEAKRAKGDAVAGKEADALRLKIAAEQPGPTAVASDSGQKTAKSSNGVRSNKKSGGGSSSAKASQRSQERPDGMMRIGVQSPAPAQPREVRSTTAPGGSRPSWQSVGFRGN